MNSIMCIDFDSFFASCEQHFNPNLRGKPIGVTASNGRTCIVAASKEAKKYGIKTGTRTFDAKRILPNIQFVKSDFERYYEITKKFLSICSRYSPTVELFSIDELFIDLTPVTNLYPSVHFVAEDIKRAVKEEIGETITISIGVSHNKLLSKLASKIDKPDGYAWITKDNLDQVYSKIHITDVSGIGLRVEKRLEMMGITTLLKLRACPLSSLVAEFGPARGNQLCAIARGEDVEIIRNFRREDVVKSVGRNYCLPQNEHDQEKILQNIYELCEEIAIKLRRLDKKARTVGLNLSGNRSMHGRKTTSYPMNKGSEIFDMCKSLYDDWNWDQNPIYQNRMVRQIGIWVSNLVDENKTTIPLFENPRKDMALKAVDRLNDKYGGHMVRNGFLTYAPKLKTVPNGFLADRFLRQQIKTEDI